MWTSLTCRRRCDATPRYPRILPQGGRTQEEQGTRWGGCEICPLERILIEPRFTPHNQITSRSLAHSYCLPRIAECVLEIRLTNIRLEVQMCRQVRSSQGVNMMGARRGGGGQQHFWSVLCRCRIISFSSDCLNSSCYPDAVKDICHTV